jgi:hypothetical protein
MVVHRKLYPSERFVPCRVERQSGLERRPENRGGAGGRPLEATAEDFEE